ncbi:MAG: hypothetical protein JO035_12710 [Betaproteobacteria bacterium]|nr:hypothetical protein [Betaproteobacteria bacterium]
MIRARAADEVRDALALLYCRRENGSAELRVAVPRGGVARARMPDRETKSRFVSAVLEAQPSDPGEELELFGESTANLDARDRRRLRRRVGVLTPGLRLISNLNGWENISLAAAYHGSPPLERVEALARDTLRDLGADPRALLARLPDELGSLERKLVAFTRLLASDPDLAVLDAVDEGLRAGEVSLSRRFEAQYRSRRPDGSLLHVDAERDPA